MKSVLFLILISSLFLCLEINAQKNIEYLNYRKTKNEECDTIKNIPESSKPDFRSLLAGVRNVNIMNKPKINGHLPAFKALEEYLSDMGFENIRYVGDDYEYSKNLCEEVFVNLGFSYDLKEFSDITMTFIMLTDKEFTYKFSTSKTAKDKYNSDTKYNFGQALRDMYHYKKNKFDSYYTTKLASRKTCWTEHKLKGYIQANGCDKLEGIYEKTGNLGAKYKVALRKINGFYHLIYLSGASNTGNWEEGEIKAILEPTATSLLFKAKWINFDKSENNDLYLTFDNGTFNLIDEQVKQLYIKLFPSSNDNFGNVSSSIQSSGSGYAISSNGYIVTNHHVTNGANSIKVRGVNGDFSKAYSAKIIVEDKNNDLSVIKIEDQNFNNLGVIPYIIANRASDVGSNIFVLGYPLRATMGDEVKLTNGIISSKSGFQGDITSYQITAPVQPGNSGGPLFDDKGNIIGIINSKHIGAENVSYAIKSLYLMNLIDLMPSPPKLQTISTVSGKPLTEQVKILKKFTYIIEIN